MWFLKPKHTLQSVAEKLLEGLEDGSVILDNEADEDAHPAGDASDHAWVAKTDAARLDPDEPRLMPRPHDGGG